MQSREEDEPPVSALATPEDRGNFLKYHLKSDEISSPFDYSGQARSMPGRGLPPLSASGGRSAPYSSHSRTPGVARARSTSPSFGEAGRHLGESPSMTSVLLRLASDLFKDVMHLTMIAPLDSVLAKGENMLKDFLHVPAARVFAVDATGRTLRFLLSEAPDGSATRTLAEVKASSCVAGLLANGDYAGPTAPSRLQGHQKYNEGVDVAIARGYTVGLAVRSASSGKVVAIVQIAAEQKERLQGDASHLLELLGTALSVGIQNAVEFERSVREVKATVGRRLAGGTAIGLGVMSGSSLPSAPQNPSLSLSSSSIGRRSEAPLSSSGTDSEDAKASSLSFSAIGGVDLSLPILAKADELLSPKEVSIGIGRAALDLLIGTAPEGKAQDLLAGVRPFVEVWVVDWSSQQLVCFTEGLPSSIVNSRSGGGRGERDGTTRLRREEVMGRPLTNPRSETMDSPAGKAALRGSSLNLCHTLVLDGSTAKVSVSSLGQSTSQAEALLRATSGSTIGSILCVPIVSPGEAEVLGVLQLTSPVSLPAVETEKDEDEGDPRSKGPESEVRSVFGEALSDLIQQFCLSSAGQALETALSFAVKHSVGARSVLKYPGWNTTMATEVASTIKTVVRGDRCFAGLIDGDRKKMYDFRASEEDTVPSEEEQKAIDQVITSGKLYNSIHHVTLSSIAEMRITATGDKRIKTSGPRRGDIRHVVAVPVYLVPASHHADISMPSKRGGVVPFAIVCVSRTKKRIPFPFSRHDEDALHHLAEDFAEGLRRQRELSYSLIMRFCSQRQARMHLELHRSLYGDGTLSQLPQKAAWLTTSTTTTGGGTVMGATKAATSAPDPLQHTGLVFAAISDFTEEEESPFPISFVKREGVARTAASVVANTLACVSCGVYFYHSTSRRVLGVCLTKEDPTNVDEVDEGMESKGKAAKLKARNEIWSEGSFLANDTSVARCVVQRATYYDPSGVRIVDNDKLTAVNRAVLEAKRTGANSRNEWASKRASTPYSRSAASEGEKEDEDKAFSRLRRWSIICLPVLWQNRLLAVVEVSREEGDGFSSEETEVLYRIAQSSAIYLRHCVHLPAFDGPNTPAPSVPGLSQVMARVEASQSDEHIDEHGEQKLTTDVEICRLPLQFPEPSSRGSLYSSRVLEVIAQIASAETASVFRVDEATQTMVRVLPSPEVVSAVQHVRRREERKRMKAIRKKKYKKISSGGGIFGTIASAMEVNDRERGKSRERDATALFGDLSGSDSDYETDSSPTEMSAIGVGVGGKKICFGDGTAEVFPIGKGLIGTAAKTGRTVATGLAVEDDRYSGEVDIPIVGTRGLPYSMMCIPILEPGNSDVDPLTEAIRSAGLSSGNIKEKEGKKSEKPRVIGVIQLVNRKQGMKFTTNDERIVKSVGRVALWSCLGLAHAWKFVSLQNRLLSVHQSLTSRLSFEELLPAIAAASRWAVGAKEKLSVLVLPYDSVRQTLLYTERSSDTSLITGMEWEEDDESETGADKDSEGSFESKATTGQREQFSFLMPVRRRRPSQVEALLSSVHKKDRSAGSGEVRSIEGYRIALEDKETVAGACALLGEIVKKNNPPYEMIVSATTAGAKTKPTSIFRESITTMPKVYSGAMLCVPIVGEAGETLAVIQIVSPSKHSFGPDVQYRLAMVAAQSSAAFQNASHFQKLSTTKTFMRTVMHDLDRKEIIAKITENVKSTMKAYHATLYLYHPRNDLLEAYFGNETAFLSAHGGIAGKVASKGESILSNSLSTDPRFDAAVDLLLPVASSGDVTASSSNVLPSSTAELSPRSSSSPSLPFAVQNGRPLSASSLRSLKLLSVPLMGHGLRFEGDGEYRFGVVGVITAIRTDIPFTADDKQVLIDVASQASIALSISQRHLDATEEAKLEVSVVSSSLPLLRSRDVQELVRESRRLLKEAVKADYTTFFFADTSSGRLIQRADRLLSHQKQMEGEKEKEGGAAVNDVDEDGLVLPLKGIAATSATESISVRVSHIARDSRFSPEVDALAIPSERREMLLKKGKHFELCSSVSDFVYPLLSVPIIDSTGKVVLGVLQAYGREKFVSSSLPRQSYASMLHRGKGSLEGAAVVDALTSLGAAFSEADERAARRLARVTSVALENLLAGDMHIVM